MNIIMLIPAIAEFFKHKVAGSIIVLVCWSSLDEVNYTKQFSLHGAKVTFSCNVSVLDKRSDYHSQGVIYIQQEQHNILDKVKKEHFMHRYKWLLLDNNIPDIMSKFRYDADITMLRDETDYWANTSSFDNATSIQLYDTRRVTFDDVYVHPRDGISLHEWAHWSHKSGFRVTKGWERIKRRRDVKKYPFRTVAPTGHYSNSTYGGTYTEYLVDPTVHDAILQCGYGAAVLLIEAVNATEVLLPVKYWVSFTENSSIMVMLSTESAELSAGVLRILMKRTNYVDYIMPLWLFSVGFTYLADRESSSNMYVEPFTPSVWWTCLAVGLILALALRVTSMRQKEKDGAYIAVIATWLQQDADGVPEGMAGRWTFTVLSVCSMLVHAYYTSAIVSALMSTGRGGPKTLRELGDSRYAIASENHDFIKDMIFSVKTNWTDLEYLKRKKMGSKFYMELKEGVKLIQEGNTAYHSEYHQIYHYLNILSDDDICKMQTIDTIAEKMAWMPTSFRGEWTEILRVAGAWIYETGLAQRLLLRIKEHPPPCRAAMLAERVTFWDVAPLLALTTFGVVVSLALLGLEIFVANYLARMKKPVETTSSENDLVPIV